VNRRVAINLVFFVAVFVVMLWWAANNIITIDALERPYTISATFEHASGIQRDAEVTYLGLAYGRVDSVERVPGGVRVQMKIDRDK
jgi:phospholipid/cholesterol/gamma-HCH transport system substrate-binding protein